MSTPWHPVPEFGFAFHTAAVMRGLLDGDIALVEARHPEELWQLRGKAWP